MIDLQAIFGGGPVATAVVVSEPALVPEAVPQPEAVDTLAATWFDGWVCRLDSHGRTGWQAPDLPDVVLFDALPLPGPTCAVCGSLEQWQDLLGRQRCGVCEADALDKALQLAERAARLRKIEKGVVDRKLISR